MEDKFNIVSMKYSDDYSWQEPETIFDESKTLIETQTALAALNVYDKNARHFIIWDGN